MPFKYQPFVDTLLKTYSSLYFSIVFFSQKDCLNKHKEIFCESKISKKLGKTGSLSITFLVKLIISVNSVISQ